MRHTKDELFLLKLHECALKLNNPCHPINRYKVGDEIGQNTRTVDNIVRHLAQANFVKKGDGNMVYLTSNGLKLIEDLLETK